MLSFIVCGHLVGQYLLVFDELWILYGTPQDTLRFEDFASASIFLILGLSTDQNPAIRLEVYNGRSCPGAPLALVPENLSAILGHQTHG